MMVKKAVVIVLASVVLTGMVGCRKYKNEVVEYLDDAELQYEGAIQKENIINALNDALHLPPEILQGKRYKDYQGNESKWDLRTVVIRHFVPSSKDKILGQNFYRDITSAEGKRRVVEILKTIE